MVGTKRFKEFKGILEEAVKNKDKFVRYSKKVLILGYGSVGQCMVPLLIKHIVEHPSQITVLEMGNQNKKTFDKRNSGNGVKYVSKQVLPDNLHSVLEKHTEPGGFVIDVSLNIDGESIIKWLSLIHI